MDIFSEIVGTVTDVNFVKDGTTKDGRSYKQWEVIINNQKFGAFGENLNDMLGQSGSFRYKENQYGKTLVFPKRAQIVQKNDKNNLIIMAELKAIEDKIDEGIEGIEKVLNAISNLKYEEQNRNNKV